MCIEGGIVVFRFSANGNVSYSSCINGREATLLRGVDTAAPALWAVFNPFANTRAIRLLREISSFSVSFSFVISLLKSQSVLENVGRYGSGCYGGMAEE